MSLKPLLSANELFLCGFSHDCSYALTGIHEEGDACSSRRVIALTVLGNDPNGVPANSLAGQKCVSWSAQARSLAIFIGGSR